MIPNGFISFTSFKPLKVFSENKAEAGKSTRALGRDQGGIQLPEHWQEGQLPGTMLGVTPKYCQASSQNKNKKEKKEASIFMTSEKRHKTMPKGSKAKMPKCRVVLDAVWTVRLTGEAMACRRT